MGEDGKIKLRTRTDAEGLCVRWGSESCKRDDSVGRGRVETKWVDVSRPCIVSICNFY
jgi:hypothetical protein